MTSKLKLDATKLNIAMANACLNPYDLCEKAEINYSSFKRILNGIGIKPKTVGKIAKALNCKVEDLI